MKNQDNKAALEEFKRELVSRRRSGVTIEGFSKIINLFFNYIQGKSIYNIGDIDVKDWQIGLMNSNKKISTIRRYSKVIYDFLDFLGLKIKIDYPKIKTPPQIKFFDINQIKLIYENLIGSREKAILSLFLEAGLKTSELINLKRKNLVEQSIILSPLEPFRIINLNNKVQIYLSEYINKQSKIANDNFIFYTKNENKINPLSYSLLNFIFKKITIRVKPFMDLPFQITPQILRNTYIYQQLINGTPIKLIKVQLGLKSDFLIKKIELKLNKTDIQNNELLDICSKCHSNILPHMKICPYCFNNLSNLICKNCNNLINFDFTFCPYCGLKIKD